jgi:hypothetical protein
LRRRSMRSIWAMMLSPNPISDLIWLDRTIAFPGGPGLRYFSLAIR